MKKLFGKSYEDIVETLEPIVRVNKVYSSKSEIPNMIFCAIPVDEAPAECNEINVHVLSFVNMDSLSPELRNLIRGELKLVKNVKKED